jgi:hypothetical protein
MNVPQSPTMPAAASSGPNLSDLVDESVRLFSIELGAMSGLAKMNGWFDKYRTEVERVAQESYRRGMLQSANEQLLVPVENTEKSANNKT